MLGSIHSTYTRFQQNAFILKRRVPIPEYSRLETADSVMRTMDPIHEEYLVVGNTNSTVLPDMEVILRNYVEGNSDSCSLLLLLS